VTGFELIVRSGLKTVSIAVLICVLALPAAILVTALAFPIWRWFETRTGIKSVGHSGPAEWCFLVHIYRTAVLRNTLSVAATTRAAEIWQVTITVQD